MASSSVVNDLFASAFTTVGSEGDEGSMTFLILRDCPMYGWFCWNMSSVMASLVEEKMSAGTLSLSVAKVWFSRLGFADFGFTLSMASASLSFFGLYLRPWGFPFFPLMVAA